MFRKMKQLWAARKGLPARLRDPSARRRFLIVVAAVLVCAYGAAVIGYVLSVPEIGVRCAFTTKVDRFFPEFLYPEDQARERRTRLEKDDEVVQVGDRRVES